MPGDGRDRERGGAWAPRSATKGEPCRPVAEREIALGAAIERQDFAAFRKLQVCLGPDRRRHSFRGATVPPGV